MSTKKRSKARKSGPHLAMAIFCDRVLEDKDNTLSAIRIVDRVNGKIPADAPEDVPSDKKRVMVSVPALLMFKSGDSPGNHRIQLIMESPSGKRSKPIFDQTVVFSEEPNGGFNLKMENNFLIKQAGLFWMHVVLDGKRVASMPLLIKIERAALPDKDPHPDK